MVDLRDERDTAALIKKIRSEMDDWRVEHLAQLIWVLHEFVSSDGVELEDLSEEEAREILDEMPTKAAIDD